MGKTKKIRVNISIDSDIKEEACKVFDKIGFDFSTAINVFLRTCVRRNRIPFTLDVRDVYNDETLEALEEIVEMKKHPERYKSYSSFAELLADIDAEDQKESSIQKRHRTSKKATS